MYCKYCGTKNEPGAAFCKNCGQPIGRVNGSGNRPESKAPSSNRRQQLLRRTPRRHGLAWGNAPSR
ncbi:zinc-ribbon domain-containing protein [Lactiplantibacillus carotarum]|uniref:zinc-ribbon domain-containing protein n=1 Tax=Lactiplantibacillus carotarum TaxID=2993456 RepID=UPI00298F15E8|nr:zinc-ribbon domain-containing protein [Lactiplantibacillus carotarum]